MRHVMFPLILIVLLGGVAWTAWRFWQILPLPAWGKAVAVTAYLLSFLVIFPHYMLGDRMPMWLATGTYVLGTSWMIFFAYALMLFALLSLGRVLGLVPVSLLKDSAAGTGLVLGVLALILVCGHVHYRHKYRETIDIQTEKPLERPLRIVLASDLHAGYGIRAKELGRWVDMINAERPDLVLFGGDLLDGAIRPVREGRYAEVFRRIDAPVYACPGNHEYISGIGGAESFFADAGIRLLKDSSAEACSIRLIGRDDRASRNRTPLSQLAPPDSLFTLLLDHQPYHLEEAEAAGIDFQFSGHTHHGQIWPGNWITDAMYEKAYGSHRRGSTRYYISSGLGLWGGRFRIGTRSEYLVLTLHN